MSVDKYYVIYQEPFVDLRKSSDEFIRGVYKTEQEANYIAGYMNYHEQTGLKVMCMTSHKLPQFITQSIKQGEVLYPVSGSIKYIDEGKGYIGLKDIKWTGKWERDLFDEGIHNRVPLLCNEDFTHRILGWRRAKLNNIIVQARDEIILEKVLSYLMIELNKGEGVLEHIFLQETPDSYHVTVKYE